MNQVSTTPPPHTTTNLCCQRAPPQQRPVSIKLSSVVQLLTQLLRLRCQQPTCWRSESPGPRTPALAPVSSGTAGDPSRGYMTLSVPPLPSSSSSLHLAPPAPPSPLCLRWGAALLLPLAASLLHLCSFFVCVCLGSFFLCVRVCCWACAACVRVCSRSPLSLRLVPWPVDHCSSRFWHGERG